MEGMHGGHGLLALSVPSFASWPEVTRPLTTSCTSSSSFACSFGAPCLFFSTMPAHRHRSVIEPASGTSETLSPMPSRIE